MNRLDKHILKVAKEVHKEMYEEIYQRKGEKYHYSEAFILSLYNERDDGKDYLRNYFKKVCRRLLFDALRDEIMCTDSDVLDLKEELFPYEEE